MQRLPRLLGTWMLAALIAVLAADGRHAAGEEPANQTDADTDPLQGEVLLGDANFRAPWQPASPRAAAVIAALRAEQARPGILDEMLAASRADRGSSFYGLGMWLISDHYGPAFIGQRDLARAFLVLWHVYLATLREASSEGRRLAEEALGDPDPAVRWAAAGAVGLDSPADDGSRGRLPSRLAADPEPLLRCCAAAVAAFAPQAARDQPGTWARLAHDSDPDVRWAGMVLCARDGVLPRESAIYLAQRLRSRTARDRAMAATALGVMTPAAGFVAERLADALEDLDPRVRHAAARGLERQGREALRARPRLLRCLGDADVSVMKAAASALAAQARHDAALVARLDALLDSREPLLRRGAMETLQRTGPGAARSIARVIRGPFEPGLRLQAIQATCWSAGTLEGPHLRMPACAERVLDVALAAAEHDPDPELRVQAVEARARLAIHRR